MDEPIYAPNVNYSPDTIMDPNKPPIKFSAHIIDFIQTLVVFGAIFAIIYWQIAQPHKVSGGSMLPNFEEGDYILTDKLSYRFMSPQYGDIIVFKNPRDTSQDYIKRIIALPGDKVKLLSNVVYVNRKPIEQNYLPRDIITREGSFLREGEEVTVADDQYIVFGDNREHSSDSREWGLLPKKDVIGRVIFQYWPPKSFGLIDKTHLRLK